MILIVLYSVLSPGVHDPPFFQVRNDDLRHNPCLKPFEELSEEERFYDYNMATQTLATLVVLGFQISTSDNKSSSHVDYQELPPDKYRMSNGYVPQPLNLERVTVPDSLEQLVERLAENAHNVWAVGRIQQGWTYGEANVSHYYSVHIIHVCTCTCTICTCTTFNLVYICTYVHVHVHV